MDEHEWAKRKARDLLLRPMLSTDADPDRVEGAIAFAMVHAYRRGVREEREDERCRVIGICNMLACQAPSPGQHSRWQGYADALADVDHHVREGTWGDEPDDTEGT